jgi:Protein of unknown function (DUF4019)
MKTRAGVPIIVLSLVLGLMCHASLMAGPDEERAGLDSAGAWLTLVDAGQYDKSWDQAASIFKESLSKDQWVKALNNVRTPLGKVISRTSASTTYTTSLPGVPDGQYVVIQYNTSFENKKAAIETVTPMLDKNGKWRVSGYFIK